MKAFLLCLPSLLLLGLVCSMYLGTTKLPIITAGPARHADCDCLNKTAPVQRVLPRGGI